MPHWRLEQWAKKWIWDMMLQMRNWDWPSSKERKLRSLKLQVLPLSLLFSFSLPLFPPFLHFLLLNRLFPHPSILSLATSKVCSTYPLLPPLSKIILNTLLLACPYCYTWGKEFPFPVDRQNWFVRDAFPINSMQVAGKMRRNKGNGQVNNTSFIFYIYIALQQVSSFIYLNNC